MRLLTLCAAFTLLCTIPAVGMAQDDTTKSVDHTDAASANEDMSDAAFRNIMKRQSRDENIFENPGEQGTTGMDIQKLTRGVDAVMAEAIKKKNIPGGVVLILRNHHVALEKAYGNRSVEPTTETCTVDTIYDMASLTKCIATAGSVMKLVEDGKISLRDSVDKYIPDWSNPPEQEALAKDIQKVKRAVAHGEVHLTDGILEFSGDTTSSTKKSWNNIKGQVGLSEKALDEIFAFPPADKTHDTLRMLMTHTAGLKPFDRYYMMFPERHAHDKIIHEIATSKLQAVPGTEFIYSDLSFITLGDIVQRVSGEGLDKFASDNIFKPLGMKDTMFNPPASLKPRIAPTQYFTVTNADGTTKSVMKRGEVHDDNAWVQDGVSGHAGLFSTVHDVAIFCQMMLNRGSYRYKQILSPITVDAMTHDQARLGPGGDQRGLGWDINTGYSNLRGDIFEGGYGHSGFTGTSVWIVPKEKLAIIILTNRVHPNGEGDSIPMRIRVANVVAGSIVESYGKVNYDRNNE